MLSDDIKAEARRLGFDLAGIITADPPAHLAEYRRWLELGRHGSMAYLAAERALQRRADPRLLLPECRSIIVLAVRYPDPNSIPFDPSFSTPPSGRVAAYAWGRDYHAVLPARLEALAGFVERAVGHPLPHRGYTDTGPLLERELAQRAGLGWIGTNTCLIHPRLGSYFLLAELLLGFDLDPDPPFTADRCGACNRCLQACPTGCILPDRTIDARRCISYLTIEEKASIPADLRPLIGRWIFGCDICQMVCPWNRFARPAFEPEFAAFPGLPEVDLQRELALLPQDFNRKYKESPLQRARRIRFLRNVAVALGNSLDRSSLPFLRSALETDLPLLREHAAWAIDWIQSHE